MRVLKKLSFLFIIQAICLVIGIVMAIFLLRSHDLLVVNGHFKGLSLLEASLYLYVLMMLFTNILFSHQYATGKVQEILFFASSSLIMAFIPSTLLYCLISCSFDFSKLDWTGFIIEIIQFKTIIFYLILILFLALYIVFYGTFIDKNIFKFFSSDGGLRGEGKLKQLHGSNLEDSRWMNKEEKSKLFQSYKYTKLSTVKKDGIPVAAKMTYGDKDMDVSFYSPCHSIIIGSTGSGKTTTFVSPMIQLLAATSAGSSMVITDPKGELFNLHSNYLKTRGYDVKVCDLRDTYASYRWNPLDSIWDLYQDYLNAHKKGFLRSDKIGDTNLPHSEDINAFGKEWYEFDGRAYANYNSLIQAIKIYKKKKFDEVYEDLNDLVSILVPIENDKDPMWEKGARSIVLAVLLAMLEDSENPALNMTKEKFNFFNMTKILQNSSNDYEDLRNYFNGRRSLSKALALSKQVVDAATQTRASYMSIVYDKLAIFNDAGICALTSASDIKSEWLAEHPTALFLKIPDEKDTRHNLAAIFILNIYKTLIKVASATDELTLPRNVYFIMDEFGNMPKIEKFDKFITVGRSRKIWFTMIIQSYAQLNNVYGETVADIVKGNCGIKMFIGSNDMGTCKEYSELCGNITVVTSSTSSSSSSKDISISNQTQVRPLIYPSELQRLNHPGDIGHSIIVTFGNFPLKTYFTPSFKVPFYQIGKMDTSDLAERFFDENTIVYKVKERNDIVLNPKEEEQKRNTDFDIDETNTKDDLDDVDENLDDSLEDENETIVDSNVSTSDLPLEEEEGGNIDEND